MKKIPSIIVRDYALLGFGFFVFFSLMRPFGMQNSVGDALWPLQSLGCCTFIFMVALLCEAVVTYVFKKPCDYSKDWHYQIQRKLIFYPLLIIILAAIIGQYFTIIEWGWSKWMYYWQDENGDFTLKWYFNNLLQDVVWCIFIALYWYFVTGSRMKEYKLQELQSLNDALEDTHAEVEEKAEMVTIAGESKESLEVSPAEILYIESIANYLSIWYFKDGELLQKRIRNTLKSVEESLADYPFLLHCHRAFMVNTRFITHVEGNSAGCQLHLFSIERTIPVSKANFDSLRQALR